METVRLICECCEKPYKAETTAEMTMCPPCQDKWDSESRWDAGGQAMLQTSGFVIEDAEDDSDFCGWLCEICGDPIYDCGHYVCGHCGTALSQDAIGIHEVCPDCEYELEYPQDETENDFDQVHDPNHPF